jgi:hypothetical protein
MPPTTHLFRPSPNKLKGIGKGYEIRRVVPLLSTLISVPFPFLLRFLYPFSNSRTFPLFLCLFVIVRELDSWEWDSWALAINCRELAQRPYSFILWGLVQGRGNWFGVAKLQPVAKPNSLGLVLYP